MAIFLFQNGGHPPSWIFKFRIFLALRVPKANVHQRTKFHQNQSSGFCDITIFSDFRMAAEIRNALWRYYDFSK